ncbi:MAG TPA: hypothetical protein VGK24_08165, partial [Candidatus Angelobacter sp.]
CKFVIVAFNKTRHRASLLEFIKKIIEILTFKVLVAALPHASIAALMLRGPFDPSWPSYLKSVTYRVLKVRSFGNVWSAPHAPMESASAPILLNQNVLISY